MGVVRVGSNAGPLFFFLFMTESRNTHPFRMVGISHDITP